MSDYLFDQAWEREKRRLDSLGEMYDAGSFEQITRAGIRPGAVVLEVGAGSGTIARWMVAQVGPTGRVVATDIDPRFLEALGGHGVEVRRHDVAADPLEESTFDLIHTRAVLQHVPKRDVAIAKLARALKPGGRLVVEDIIMPHPAAYPPLPAWAKILDGMTAGFRSIDADPFYGLRAPSAMTEVGLAVERCEGRVAMMHTGTSSIEFVSLSVEQIGDKLVGAGVVTADELREVLDAFRTPGRTLTAAIMITTVGVAPAARS
jgi:SAM-dependent methyltransferase